MSYKVKVPLKNVKIGDKVKSKDLIKNKLAKETVQMTEVKTWVVEDVQQSHISVRSGKNSTTKKRKTLVVLTAKRNGKAVRTRVWWID